MANKWQRTTLGDVLELKRGYDLPKRRREPGDVPVISSSGWSGTHSVAKANGPGVVTGRYGTIGEVYYCEGDFWPLNTTLYVKDFKGNDEKFVFYLLKTIDYLQYSDKAAVPGVNRNHLHLAEVWVPTSTDEQRTIAHILGTLDDKIELNRQMNATLEAMAQALFKSWFVDFDPVIDNALAAGQSIPEPLRARAEVRKGLGDQRKPLPEGIRKLFPDRFVFNEEMGWVPEGWDVKSIEEVSSAIGMGPFGSNIKVDTFVDEGVPIVNGQHLNETLLVEGKHNFITEAHAERLKKSLVYPGDLVFTHRGTIGQVSLVPSSGKHERFIVSQSQMLLRPNPELLTGIYLIYFFRSHIGQHRLLANAAQVGVPSIARPSSHLKSIKLMLPGRNCLNEFDRLCGCWLESIQANRSQVDSLSSLRDTLLPKLLSGELRVPDAQEYVEDTPA